MSYMQEKNKIALLQQYVLTLERENFAKNGQTKLLYQHLNSVKQQNEILKSFIETMKNKWDQQKYTLTQQIQQKDYQPQTQTRNFGQQLRNSVDVNSLKAVAEDMKADLEAKEFQICQLMQDKERKQDQIVKLREELTISTCKVIKTQQKIRHQMQVIKQLQGQIFGLRNSRNQTGSSRISFAKFEVGRLVKQNNQLIQKVRLLQKQKNQYYQQLKVASPIRVRPDGKQNRSVQKMQLGKSQKWNAMEQKLRSIRNQNQQLRANLAII